MPWHPEDAAVLPSQQCRVLTDEDRAKVPNSQNEKIVFSLHIPVNGEVLTRWFSYMLVLVYPELKSLAKPNATQIWFDAKCEY